MLKTLIGAIILSGVAVTAAHAVDVVNSDKYQHSLTVVKDGQKTKVLIEPHAALKGVCDTCEIQVGEDSIKADGTQVVTIQYGEFTRK